MEEVEKLQSSYISGTATWKKSSSSLLNRLNMESEYDPQFHSWASTQRKATYVRTKPEHKCL